uniref:CSON010792 protein n=1 Tax=Culicoides sonorensis TaxID=179676 RepID=A0A336M2F7_CULSO
MDRGVKIDLSTSIKKALTIKEKPIKPKHIRGTILGTYHTQSFWAIVIRCPLKENRIIAWKFMYLLHKVLREGNQHVSLQAMSHRHMIQELGKLWGHLNDGYEVLIKQYSKLLCTKIEFHAKHPAIESHISIEYITFQVDENKSSDFFFGIVTDMFDYLNEIIALSALVYETMTKFNVNPMSSAGQCRIEPLTIQIEESYLLYNHSLHFMHVLHSKVSYELLAGHRSRFNVIFNELKSIYNKARGFEYLENLITIPMLFGEPPTFVNKDYANIEHVEMTPRQSSVMTFEYMLKLARLEEEEERSRSRPIPSAPVLYED